MIPSTYNRQSPMTEKSQATLSGFHNSCISLCIAGIFVLPYLRLFWWVPKYFYLLIAGILWVSAIHRLFKERCTNSAAMVYMAALSFFCFWLMLSSVWTVSTDHYRENIKHLVLLLAISWPVAVAANRRVVDSSVKWIVFLHSRLPFTLSGVTG